MSYPYLPTRWLVTTPNLADDPDVFPLLPGQMFVSQKAPTWTTTVKTSASGRQVRATCASAPIWSFKVGYDFIRDRITTPELARLLGFFNTRQGQLGSFFYYDPTDNAVVDQPVATGDGQLTTFQLTRTVGAGGPYAFVEPVYVLNGTPTVTVAGAATTAFSLGAYGSITFTTPPPEGAAIAWSGGFMFWCRFTTDQITPAQQVASLWSLDGLTFESLKP
jgi:uncharacterized protein (TIGR02217 family)